MPSVRHGAATLYDEEFGGGFPLLTFATAGLQHPTTELAALVLAGNDEPHPLPISEEPATLRPSCELVRERKTEPALSPARRRVAESLATPTPRGS